MADAKISALTAATAALGTHEFPVNESAASKKVTGAQILALVGNTIANQSTSDQTISAASSALLTGSTIAVPSGKLRVGTILLWRIALSKTGAGTAANTFIVRLGTAGTIADAAILTFTLPVGTAVADVGVIDLMVTIRGPLSASCIAQGNLTLMHNLSATGLATVPVVSLNVTSSAFDATTASLIASLSCTTAASTVLTFQQVVSNAMNL